MQSMVVYKAAAYARASKDDTDGASTRNQIELIRDYVNLTNDIRIASVREDNGFSGVDFSRPSFVEMMRDIEAGKINCVIVKDLSRLGRNYIEVGELIDVVFPRQHVRLIAINDQFDSIKPRNDSDDLIIPFKNLINEQYLRDFSVKIRSNLSVNRKNGNFVGAFTPYGYMRDAQNRHQLVIDMRAAEVVRDIFRWKINGMSHQRIAEQLNEMGEPSPAEYKKIDTNYIAQFQTHLRALWSAVAVERILRNPTYIGTLVQGRQTTPNYKVKQRIIKPQSEWNIVACAHQPIINRDDFDLVTSLLMRDTRTAPGQDTVYPFSGMVFCGDCGNNMIRTKSDRYHYYVCASSRGKLKTCSAHSIQQAELERAVMETLTYQIICMFDIDASWDKARSIAYRQKADAKRTGRIAERETKIDAYKKYKHAAYEDYKNGVISQEDYKEFDQEYTECLACLEQALEKLKAQASLITDPRGEHLWIEQFKRNRKISEISRTLAVNLIERIDVYHGKRISVGLRCCDGMVTALDASKHVVNGINR